MKNTSDLKPDSIFAQRASPVIKGRIIDLAHESPLTLTLSPKIGGEGRDYPLLDAWKRELRSCRGFTLLEIMVAVAIMAIVLVSVYKLHAQTISMNGSARFYTTAPLLAQRTVAEIQAFPDRRQAIADGDFGDEFTGYSRRVLIDDVSAEILGSTAKDLKKIEATISFNHNEFVYTLRTYSILQEP
jgi:general secretion pathway protein I